MKQIYILILLIVFSSAANCLEINVYGSSDEELSPVNIKLIDAENGELIFEKMQLSDNSFDIGINKKRIFLQIESPNYAKYFLPIELQDFDVEINVTLEALQLNPASKSPKILTYEGDCDRLSTYDMNKEGDIFTTKIPNKESVKAVIYRLAKGNDLLLPTNADTYTYECDRFYALINADGGEVKIEFNPQKFPAYDGEAVVKSESEIEAQVNYLAELSNVELNLTNAYTAISGGSHTKITADDLKPDFDKIESLQEDVPADYYKEVYSASYIKVAGVAFLTGNSELVEEDVLSAAIEKLDFKSPLWKYYVGSMGVAVAAKHLTGDRYKEYFDSLMLSNPYPEVREDFVFQSLVYSYTRGEKAKVRQFYEHLFVFFPESKYISTAKQLMERIENSMIGEEAPIFNVASLDNSDIKFSNEYFKGKYLFIDFWATWCGPCVREMPHLHDAYEKYKGKIEFLSFSLDKRVDKIGDFRGKKWKMPWNHSFLVGGFGNMIARRFKVKSIPKPILIGPDGKIIAEGSSLRGANLMNTLKMHLEGK